MSGTVAPSSPHAVGAGEATTTVTPGGSNGWRAAWRVLALVALLGLLVLVALLSLGIGSKSVTIPTVIDAFTSYDATNPDHLIVRGLRVPRTVLGVLVGVALGLAGTVMQGLSRNALADPGILGVNAGAAMAVVIAVYLLDITSLAGYVWFGFAGAGAAAVGVFVLGSLGRDGASPIKLVLAGVAITYLLAAMTRAITLIDVQSFDVLRFWVVGSLAGRDLDIARQAWPFIAVGTVMALASGRTLNALALGDDMARALGMRLNAARAFTILTIVILAGAATAIAGPIAFLGLTVPHVGRMIVGPDNRWVLPYAAVLAPLMLLGADVLGRVVARPQEIQVGVVAVLLGAPVFIALVRRRRVEGL